jgi:AP2 domain
MPWTKADVSRPDVFTSEWLTEPASRWAIGIFVADGSLSGPSINAQGYQTSPRVTLRLDWPEADGAHHFAAALGLPPARVRTEQCGPRQSLMAAVSLRSPRVGRLHDLGFPYGKKSHTVRAPEELEHDVQFWRGVIDGDGYASMSGGSVHFALRSQSDALLKQFQVFSRSRGWVARLYGITKRGGGRCLIQGDAAVEAIRVLYADAPAIARKRDKALALADAWESRARPSSPYRGVTWDKERGKWVARAGPRGAHKHVGRFDSELEAAQAVEAQRKRAGR